MSDNWLLHFILLVLCCVRNMAWYLFCESSLVLFQNVVNSQMVTLCKETNHLPYYIFHQKKASHEFRWISQQIAISQVFTIKTHHDEKKFSKHAWNRHWFCWIKYTRHYMLLRWSKLARFGWNCFLVVVVWWQVLISFLKHIVCWLLVLWQMSMVKCAGVFWRVQILVNVLQSELNLQIYFRLSKSVVRSCFHNPSATLFPCITTKSCIPNSCDWR